MPPHRIDMLALFHALDLSLLICLCYFQLTRVPLSLSSLLIFCSLSTQMYGAATWPFHSLHFDFCRRHEGGRGSRSGGLRRGRKGGQRGRRGRRWRVLRMGKGFRECVRSLHSRRAAVGPQVSSHQDGPYADLILAHSVHILRGADSAARR